MRDERRSPCRIWVSNLRKFHTWTAQGYGSDSGQEKSLRLCFDSFATKNIAGKSVGLPTGFVRSRGLLNHSLGLCPVDCLATKDIRAGFREGYHARNHGCAALECIELRRDTIIWGA